MDTQQQTIVLGDNIEIGERVFMFSERADMNLPAAETIKLEPSIGRPELTIIHCQSEATITRIQNIVGHIVSRIEFAEIRLQRIEEKLDLLLNHLSLWQRIWAWIGAKLHRRR